MFCLAFIQKKFLVLMFIKLVFLHKTLSKESLFKNFCKHFLLSSHLNFINPLLLKPTNFIPPKNQINNFTRFKNHKSKRLISPNVSRTIGFLSLSVGVVDELFNSSVFWSWMTSVEFKSTIRIVCVDFEVWLGGREQSTQRVVF